MLLRFVWVCEWCIPRQVCIVTVLSVCISDEPSVCCYILLMFVTCLLFVTEVTHPYDCSVCLCVLSGQDFLGAVPARRQGATAGLPTKRNLAPISGAGVV